LVLVLLVGAAAAGWGVALSRGSSRSLPNDPVREKVAQLKVTDLEITTSFGATIGYLPSPVQALTNAGGVVTGLPTVGSVITQGQALFDVNGQPVLLLYGSIPEWRSLAAGVPPGADITELESNLNQLGYAGDYQLPENGIYSYAVGEAVERFLATKGIPSSTALAFGTVIFAPGPLLVSALPVALGSTVGPGTAVITVTSTQRAVTGTFSPGGGAPVAVGQSATVTPDDGGVPLKGTVAAVTTKLTSGTNEATVSVALSGSPTLPPGDVDAQVSVVTKTVPDVFAVPVQALVALVEGGYALEVPKAKGGQGLVAVKVGVSGSNNLVQISGRNLHSGLSYLVPTLY
jgi:hypothetical protein